MAAKKTDDGLSPPWREPALPDPNQPYFAPGRSALENDAALCALQPPPTEEELIQAQEDLDVVQGELGNAYFGSLGGDAGVSREELKKLQQEIAALKRRIR